MNLLLDLVALEVEGYGPPVSPVIWGQFHQRSTSSFYARRSQKRQKDSQVKLLFALSGSLRA